MSVRPLPRSFSYALLFLRAERCVQPVRGNSLFSRGEVLNTFLAVV